MKKLFFLLLAICFIIPISACATQDSRIDDSISEIRLNVYEGRGDVFDVNIYIGKRESPYKVDGVSGKLTDYCLISVMPANDLKGEPLNFSLSGGKYTESGTLVEEPYSGRYRFDTGKYYADVPEINITLTIGEIVESIIVKAQYTTEMISWKDALSVAKSNLSESFNGAFSGDDFYGEVFIRFINNPMMGEDKYFWFVMLKDRNGKMSSVLIDCLSREVVAKNIL